MAFQNIWDQAAASGATTFAHIPDELATWSLIDHVLQPAPGDVRPVTVEDQFTINMLVS